MEFEVTATIETIREVTGTINVTKKDVVDAGFCKSTEDGDSTAWYGYVGDFLESEFEPESSEYGYSPSDIKNVDGTIISDSCHSILIDW